MCQRAVSRRDFFQRMIMGSVTGLSILDLARSRAAWAQALSPGAATDLFDIEKVAEGVYFAVARPQEPQVAPAHPQRMVDPELGGREQLGEADRAADAAQPLHCSKTAPFLAHLADPLLHGRNALTIRDY